ncbi:MAG TPA: hypothetical protein VLM37_13315 [Fibrobacteraceae bacterium]|nr:hypothetical protein [Fibrobacteraceae bacterium]
MPVFLLILFAGLSWGGEWSLFSSPDIHTHYSRLLLEKNAKADSLLPALDGDRAFEELIRSNPKLWSIERLDKLGEMVTKLKVEVEYIDGLREEQYCEIDTSHTQGADLWSVRMGVDFVSGSSNTVPIHVQQCLEYVKSELGYKVRKGDQVVEVPPKKVLEEIKASHIPQVLDPDLQTKILKTHREVKVSGGCPTDIEAYAILLDVWEQVKSIQMDLAALNDYLNPDMNGGRVVHSCAFNREWNQRYSDEASLYCDEATERCKYVQSQDGTTRWLLDPQSDAFVFQPFWGLFGGKSVHKGGTLLDLRILPLSTSMFLEAYLDTTGAPVSLGLITVPEKKGP